MQYPAHRFRVDDVNVTEMLPKDNKFFLHAFMLIFEYLDVIDTLLKLFVIFLLECVDIEDEKMAIIAADPGEVVVHPARKKAMTTCLFDDDRAQVLIVDVQLVAFPSREDQS